LFASGWVPGFAAYFILPPDWQWWRYLFCVLVAFSFPFALSKRH
jgi:hypothetical protein